MKKTFFAISFLCIQSLLLAAPVITKVQEMDFGVLFQGESKFVTDPKDCSVNPPEVGIVAIENFRSAMNGTLIVTFPAYLVDTTERNYLAFIGPKAIFCQDRTSAGVTLSNGIATEVLVLKNYNNSTKNRIYTFGILTVPNTQKPGDYSGTITVEFLY